MRAGALLALAACAPAPEALSLVLVTPEDGATVCGDPLHVEVEVDGMRLAEPVEDDPEPGTGHVDLTLNGQDAAMFWQRTVDIANVEPGEYQLKVELSNADHTPVEPYTGDFVYVAVVGPEAPECE